MFGKLKNKLKDWTSKVSGEDEAIEELKEEGISEEEILEEKEEEKKEKKGFFKKMFSKKEKEEEEESEPEEKEESKEKPKKETKKKTTSKKKESKPKKETKELPTDEKLKEEVKKGNYKELPEVSTPGSGKTEPDTEKLEEIKESKAKPTTKDDTSGRAGNADNSGDVEEPKKEKKTSLFKKLTSSKKTITEDEFFEYSEDLEMILLENNVALEVVDKIVEEIRENIVNQELSKKAIIDTITKTLKEKIEEVLIEPFNIIKEIKEKDGPYVMIFCGINGVGKTTQIAKFANMLKKEGLTCTMAAGDTFRAAAVEQLKTHGENLDVKVISHDYGSDPAAVGFDAIKYAEKNNIDVVLIDTAGRIHTATNLLREMEKIKRVCNPDRTIFVGESITGNDAVDQVKAFNETIGIDGIFLSKADIDEKGGTALSVGYITNKPIIYLGTGQNYEDIEPFDKKKFLEKLDLD